MMPVEGSEVNLSLFSRNTHIVEITVILGHSWTNTLIDCVATFHEKESENSKVSFSTSLPTDMCLNH